MPSPSSDPPFAPSTSPMPKPSDPSKLSTTNATTSQPTSASTGLITPPHPSGKLAKLPSASTKCDTPATDPFANCVSVQEQRWASFGLESDEKMYRFENGPPIFGTHAAYEQTRVDSKNDPDELALIYVHLQDNLSDDQYERHYRVMYDRAIALERRGIAGAGIIKDLCEDPEWMEYYCVYTAATLQEIQQDTEVTECYIIGNEKYRKCGSVRVDTWAQAGMVKAHWNKRTFDEGEANGHYIRFPPNFRRADLGRDNIIFIIDDFLDTSLVALQDAAGQSRAQVGYDLFPNHTPGYQNQPFEGHSDQMMVLAAGKTGGIAPAARIIAINVYEEGDPDTNPHNIYAALHWIRNRVESHGLQRRAVVNVSLSGGNDIIARGMQNYIERRLLPLDVVVVHSAGNTNREITPAAPIFPQMSPHVIVVGGMNHHGWCYRDVPDANNPAELVGSNRGDVVTVVAPATRLVVHLNGDDQPSIEFEGTSGATALVSGFVACLLDGNRTHADILNVFNVDNAQKHVRAPVNDIVSPILCVD
ncbi:subtilisin-like protein [Ascobolus immersus RN42]|uniref:Subtilisin-like protein n=1 Tax=Ascobolus immersus RN42 TaxID=1160509 RepID=A0A3N4I7T9_ASCIM|nr:subtilisin-like protein [Ascobolus immersus RN42]